MAKTKTGDSKKAVYILMESSQTNKYYVGSSMDLSTRFKSYNRKQRGNRIIDNIARRSYSRKLDITSH